MQHKSSECAHPVQLIPFSNRSVFKSECIDDLFRKSNSRKISTFVCLLRVNRSINGTLLVSPYQERIFVLTFIGTVGVCMSLLNNCFQNIITYYYIRTKSNICLFNCFEIGWVWKVCILQFFHCFFEFLKNIDNDIIAILCIPQKFSE